MASSSASRPALRTTAATSRGGDQSAGHLQRLPTVPPEVAELSELLYWNSGGHAIGATGQGEGGGHSRLSALFARERRLALVRGACEEALAGARLTHLFDAVAPGATERLFCGGVYSSSGDAVEALKADCAAAFTAHPQYRAILQKRNELYTRLNRAMQRLGRGEEEASRESPEVPRPAGAREPGPSGALSDALKRKEQYLRQVATEGLAKLQSCLAQQSETLTETLCLRVWGDVVYWELARMRNHFLYRRAFVSGPWEDRRAGEGAAFENSKYIKTHLFTQTLSSEHLHALTHSLYTFITGPLAEESGLFPPPSNVALARCCDAAGTLPHQKAFLTSLIWPGPVRRPLGRAQAQGAVPAPGGHRGSGQAAVLPGATERDPDRDPVPARLGGRGLLGAGPHAQPLPLQTGLRLGSLGGQARRRGCRL